MNATEHCGTSMQVFSSFFVTVTVAKWLSEIHSMEPSATKVPYETQLLDFKKVT